MSLTNLVIAGVPNESNPFLAAYKALQEVGKSSPKSPRSPKEINQNIVQLMNACLAHYSEIPHFAGPVTYALSKGCKCQVTYSSPTHRVMSVDVIKQGKDATGKQEQEKGVLFVDDKFLTFFVINSERLSILKVQDWMISVNPLKSEGMISDFAYPEQYSTLEAAAALTVQSASLFLHSLKTASDRKAQKSAEFKAILADFMYSLDTVGIVVRYAFEDKVNPQNKS